MSWIRLDDLLAEYTVFSKDRDNNTDPSIFRAAITATDGFLKMYLADADDFSDIGSATGSDAVPASEWTFVGYSVTLDINAVDSTVRLWTNDSSGTTSPLASYRMLDSATPYPAFIGTHRTDTTTYAGWFKGFVYNFYIYNDPTSTGDQGRYGNTGCTPACGAWKCTSIYT